MTAHTKSTKRTQQRITSESEKVITMEGCPLTLRGSTIQEGQTAPDYTVVDKHLSPVKLSDFSGKTIVISSVPSLDTGICDKQTRRFNDEATKLGKNVVVLTISMDLPFAQSRWCQVAGVKRVKTLSDYRMADFGMKYGLLIMELRLLARAVIVVDRGGVIRYKQIVPEITNEPDYDAAITCVKKLL